MVSQLHHHGFSTPPPWFLNSTTMVSQLHHHGVGWNVKANCKKTRRSFNEQKITKFKQCTRSKQFFLRDSKKEGRSQKNLTSHVLAIKSRGMTVAGPEGANSIRQT